ncbi:alpha/beta hydrolase family protein [Geodermatophilus sp. CPCC 206100]|uniref:alpha/beta hydrolase family protein n=1 Tax=Geodermatophilus sp. CPCC 206100 TaxID=3020054 RepID=UPI003B00B3B4
MPDEKLTQVLRIHAGRLVGDGVPVPDVQAAERELERWDDWFGFWADRGAAYERLADEALAAGHDLTAGRLLWSGSLSYHYAQFLWWHDPVRKTAGQEEKVRLYRRAAPLLSPPARPFEVAVEGLRVPGFLRVPDGPGPHPCVILLGGLESTKEESLLFEQLCLERGVATCAFDGPGQGEFLEQSPLRPDFERFTSAVVDVLEDHPAVRGDRIGVLGRSLGGYYAVRSAASDPRLRACGVWGAFFDLSFFDDLSPSAAAGFAYVSGHPDPGAARDVLQRTIDLSDVAGALRCPTYVLHGGSDDLIPVAQVDRLREALSPDVDVTWDIPPEGNHCCHDLHHLVRPRMADWLADVLR